MSEAGRVVTRERIMSEVWDEHWFGSTKTLDMHISALRRKLGDPADEPGRITTLARRRVPLRAAMTRRVVLAIAGVAALAVIGFGIPLGAAIRQLYVKEALLRLDREATAATIEVPQTFGEERVELPRLKHGSVHRAVSAVRSTDRGRGPLHSDAVVVKALRGQVSDTRHRGSIVVGVPVTSNERVIADHAAAGPVSADRRPGMDGVGRMAVLGAGVVALAALGRARSGPPAHPSGDGARRGA